VDYSPDLAEDRAREAAAAKQLADEEDEADSLFGTGPVSTSASTKSTTSRKNKKKKRRAPKGALFAYLFGYNMFLFLGWVFLLSALIWDGLQGEFTRAAGFATITLILEVVALLEIVNAVLGLVPGNTMASVMLHGGRLMCIHLFYHPAAQYEINSIYLATYILIAVWAFGEMIRYPFYLLTVCGLTPGYMTTWLRYTAGLVLMPIGFAAEIWLIYYTKEYQASPWNEIYGYYLIVYLFGPFLLLKGVYTSRVKKLKAFTSKKTN
jgi:hypothetical protein